MIARMRERGEAGVALVITAISMFVLLLMAGFAIDIGSWYLTASRLQRASDSAALAGAISLPDVEAAKTEADAAYARNGYEAGAGGIDVVHSVTSERFTTRLTANDVPTYFVKMVIPSISITRTSAAARPTTAPALGSPFNVLGTGDLDIPGVPKQNFWLAINGYCSPKEDGDYFLAKYDGNKRPMTDEVDSNYNYIPSSEGLHECTDAEEKNPDYQQAGYSYFIDVPAPSVIGGSVAIKVYDAAFNKSGTSDKNISLPKDVGSYIDTRYHLYDTKGTPDDHSDDGPALVSRIVVTTDPNHPETKSAWMTLYTAPYDKIKNGAQYRLQVTHEFNEGSAYPGRQRGINSFAIGAFRSWNPVMGCDTRTSPDCPKVYGRHAVSVYNNLGDATGGTASFYFAEMGTAYVGKAFEVHLWDPGEGVNKLELLGPDGTPLVFTCSVKPATPSGCDGGYLNGLATGGTGPQPGTNRSNQYKFNDRLVTLTVTLPNNYAQMVNSAGGSHWLRIRYTVSSAPGDRTTWGLTVPGETKTGPAKLMRVK